MFVIVIIKQTNKQTNTCLTTFYELSYLELECNSWSDVTCHLFTLLICEYLYLRIQAVCILVIRAIVCLFVFVFMFVFTLMEEFIPLHIYSFIYIASILTHSSSKLSELNRVILEQLISLTNTDST